MGLERTRKLWVGGGDGSEMVRAKGGSFSDRIVTDNVITSCTHQRGSQAASSE